ncbi:hypothetical protein EWD52_23425 [Salmonella enterica subsp. enterica serovar Braenderup]|nr:hypothetical protein [Salmonella enterica subsp. enterica serovar Braenderup]ECD1500250.1 hypothetical protein [Salmonella enterica subsp. enterica serovar Braenderup]
MKRYHVISISVLLGLIAGLSVSKAQANTLICNQTVLENSQGVDPDSGALVVQTKPGFATVSYSTSTAGFHMHRVINKGWKASDTKNRLYEGVEIFKGGKATLDIAMLDGGDQPITVQYEATGKLGTVRIFGMNCTNAK